MKTIYTQATNQGWLVMVWLLSVTLSAQAQSTTPPVLQWQRVIEGNIDFNSTIYAAKSTTGEFGILTGTTLTRLTASGAVKWSRTVEGSVVTSSNPLTYSTTLRTSGLVATPDGGFLVQANDADNLYLIKKDANGDRVWSKIINPVIEGTNSGFRGLDLIQTADGGYMSFAGYYVTNNSQYTLVVKLDQNGTIIRIQSQSSLGSPSVNGNPPVGNPIYRHLALPDGGLIQIGAVERFGAGILSSSATMSRFDAQGNEVASKRYPTIFRDIIPNPDGSGSFIVTTDGDKFALILPNGDLVSTIPNPPFSLYAPAPFYQTTPVLASDGTGQPFFVALNPGRSNASDFQLRGFNQQNQVVWTKTLGGSGSDDAQTVLATGDGYLLVGTTTSTDGDVQGKQGSAVATWVVKLSKTAALFALTQPTYDCATGAITFNTTGGDGSPITFSAPGIARSSATSNTGTVEQGLRNDPKPLTITATQNGISVNYGFDFKGYCTNPQPPVTPPGPPPTGGALTLLAPTYDCVTGAITFNTSGGDGPGTPAAPIEFMAAGITGWTTNPNQMLDACARTCADIPPFIIQARQSGKLVTYSWSRQTYCANPASIVRVRPIDDITVAVGQSVNFNIGTYFSSSVTTNWNVDAKGLPPGISIFFRQEGGGSPNPTWVLVGTPTTAGVYSVTASASANGGSGSTTFKFTVTNASSSLTLLAPTYDCATGAITFRSSGGNGSPIEFMAIGITDWTTNPNQFVDKESRTVNDVKPFTLVARQNGVMVTYVWDLKAACGRGVSARLGAGERLSELSISVLGNPVEGKSVEVEIRGVEGQPVHLNLIDLQGRTLHQQRIGQADSAQRISVPVGNGQGVLLLNVHTATQRQQVKLLKP